MATVPDGLIDDVALVGPKERIVERLAAWKAAGEKKHVGALLASFWITGKVVRE